MVNYVNGSDIPGMMNLNSAQGSIHINMIADDMDETVAYIIYYLLDILIDKNCCQDLLGYTEIFEGRKWLNISYESLLKTFKVFLVSRVR